MRQIFDAQDTSRDGILQPAELMQIFDTLALDIPTENFDEIMQLFDDDCSGGLDFEEFFHLIYVA